MQSAARRRAGFILAGLLVTSLIYLGLRWGGIASVAAVLAMIAIATRIGRARKQQLGLGEPLGGRDAWQVFANIGCAAVFALIAIRAPVFVLASIAALAEAAADTCQSEIGEIASQRAWSITSLRAVPPGTDGGISLVGTLTGATVASVVAAVAAATHVILSGQIWIVATAGILGTAIDSLLGATVERRGWLGNNGVNFLSTLAAGLLAICAAR
jgi:uncharacterized protein (TIGR00297 family)